MEGWNRTIINSCTSACAPGPSSSSSPSVLAFVAISALHLKYSKVPVAVNPLDLVVVVVRR